MNRRRCEICDVDIHRASYCRHLRSEKHMRNEHEIQNERVKKFINGEMLFKLSTSSGIEINFDRDRVNQFYSKLTIGPNHPEY